MRKIVGVVEELSDMNLLLLKNKRTATQRIG